MINELIKGKVPLSGLNKSELISICEEFDEPIFRGEQIFNWIYVNRVREINRMDNLSKDFRYRLDKIYSIPSIELVRSSLSPKEKTSKYLFKISTGEQIESVLMKENNRVTVCLSTQVGCALGCTFCATAKMGFKKNLSVGEIIDQFIILQNISTKRITNVVFMGMGEPFLNYERVISAAKLLNMSDGINLGSRKIIISTAGVVPKIKRFSDEGWKFKLAVSLNSTNDKSRSEIMPINKKYNINEIISAAHYYYQKSKSFITFEYVLIENKTDSIDDAKRLKILLKNLPCKVNLIPYNSFDDSYQRSNNTKIKLFVDELKTARFTVTVRWSNGTDIDAGCGQLAVFSGDKK